MSSHQAEVTAERLNHLLDEWSDGYVFIGFDPQTQQPMIIAHLKDAKTTLALNILMAQIVAGGGLQLQETTPE